MIVVSFDVLRVVEIAVVALSVVFPDKFPVGVDGVVDRLGHLGAVATLRPKHRFDQCPRGTEVVRPLGQVHKNKAAQVFDGHGRQAKRPGVQPVLHATARQQPAILAVDPLVIRADQLPRRAAWLVAEQRATMAADVVKGPHLTVVTADHEQRVGTYVKGNVVSRFRDLTIVTHEQPALAPNPIKICVKKIVRREKLTRQAPPIRACPGSCCDRVKRLVFKRHGTHLPKCTQLQSKGRCPFCLRGSITNFGQHVSWRYFCRYSMTASVRFWTLSFS